MSDNKKNILDNFDEDLDDILMDSIDESIIDQENIGVNQQEDDILNVKNTLEAASGQPISEDVLDCILQHMPKHSKN